MVGTVYLIVEYYMISIALSYTWRKLKFMYCFPYYEHIHSEAVTKAPSARNIKKAAG